MGQRFHYLEWRLFLSTVAVKAGGTGGAVSGHCAETGTLHEYRRGFVLIIYVTSLFEFYLSRNEVVMRVVSTEPSAPRRLIELVMFALSVRDH